MTDEQTPTLEDGDEVVAEAITADAPQVDDNGQEQDQPAEVDAEQAEAEDKTKSAERRERRKAAQEALRTSEAEANARANDAQSKIDRMRQAAQQLKKPTHDQYADYEDYQAALAAHHGLIATDSRDLQRLEDEAAQNAQQLKNISQQKQQEAAQNWASQVEEASAKYPDFQKVALSESVPITPEIARFIADSDNGADIAYEMGKNHALATAMHGLSEVELARAFGRLEAQLSAPKPKTTSTAPAPINPVRGKATASKDPASMSAAEFKAWRDKGGTF